MAGGSRYIVSRAQTSTLRPCVCPALLAGGNLDQHNCINKIGRDYSNLHRLLSYLFHHRDLLTSCLSNSPQMLSSLVILIWIFCGACWPAYQTVIMWDSGIYSYLGMTMADG